MITICMQCDQPRLARWVSTPARAVAVVAGRAVRIGPTRAAVLGIRYECACDVPVRAMRPSPPPKAARRR